MKILLCVGDWSLYGHGITYDGQFDINISAEELWDSYLESREKLGFDLREEVCAGYGKSELPYHIKTKLREVGIPFKDDYSYDGEAWCELFLNICRFSRPELIWSNSEEAEIINIGGYGLYE